MEKDLQTNFIGTGVSRTRNDEINKWSKIPSAFYLQPFYSSQNTHNSTHTLAAACYGIGPCKDHYIRLALFSPLLPTLFHRRKDDWYGNYRNRDPTSSSSQSERAPLRRSAWAVHFNVCLCVAICVCQSLLFSGNSDATFDSLERCCRWLLRLFQIKKDSVE